MRKVVGYLEGGIFVTRKWLKIREELQTFMVSDNKSVGIDRPHAGNRVIIHDR